MIKVIELFAGVGSQTQALKNIGVEHEVVGIAEIDKYAISSYMQLHGDTPLLGDISKIDSLPNADLWTYSFPCQDLSVAGKGAGIKEGTRSGLLFEVERLLEVSNKPKYLLMENVKNLVGKKNKPDFDRWCQKLEELGYKNYWQVLNAKDYGVPQNRERVFMVSIFGDGEYKFPKKEVLNIRLKDVLEREVEEKYYLSEEYMDRFLKSKPISSTDIKILGTTVGTGEGTNCRHWVHDSSGIVGVLSATDYKQPKQILEPKIMKVDIPQKVKVRANKINTFELCEFLRRHKNGMRNQEIADRLKLPKTKVEHWFRNDNSFAIPDADVWFRLKHILKITDSNYDKAITEFETRDGVFEKSNRCYIVDGLAPTLTTATEEKILEPKQTLTAVRLGGLFDEEKSKHQAGSVWDKDYLSPTLDTMQGGHRQPCILIKNATKKGYLEAECGDYINLQFPDSETRRGRVQKEISATLMCNDNNGVLEQNFRIRKLTPRECWRLMGWKDEEFNKIQGISNSQLYKQAGNGIVVNVLEKIFKNMF